MQNTSCIGVYSKMLLPRGLCAGLCGTEPRCAASATAQTTCTALSAGQPAPLASAQLNWFPIHQCQPTHLQHDACTFYTAKFKHMNYCCAKVLSFRNFCFILVNFTLRRFYRHLEFNENRTKIPYVLTFTSFSGI
jgi:hypothetical protein